MSIELKQLNDGTIADAVPVMENFNTLRAAVEGATTGAAVGDLRFTALPTVESGWLACDGSAVSRTTYATLFAAIGIAYGAGDGEHTFNLPDYRERVPVGSAEGGLARGAKGGEATHTLTEAEMPKHHHSVNWDVPGEEAAAGAQAVHGRGMVNTAANSADAGSGAAHNNMQPYSVCNVWIKR